MSDEELLKRAVFAEHMASRIDPRIGNERARMDRALAEAREAETAMEALIDQKRYFEGLARKARLCIAFGSELGPLIANLQKP